MKFVVYALIHEMGKDLQDGKTTGKMLYRHERHGENQKFQEEINNLKTPFWPQAAFPVQSLGMSTWYPIGKYR